MRPKMVIIEFLSTEESKRFQQQAKFVNSMFSLGTYFIVSMCKSRNIFLRNKDECKNKQKIC